VANLLLVFAKGLFDARYVVHNTAVGKTRLAAFEAVCGYYGKMELIKHIKYTR
jgi:hypothetical protein